MSKTLLLSGAMAAVIASGALSGCLVIAPECTRCGPGNSADGGVSEALDSEGSEGETNASDGPGASSGDASSAPNSAGGEGADTGGSDGGTSETPAASNSTAPGETATVGTATGETVPTSDGVSGGGTSANDESSGSDVTDAVSAGTSGAEASSGTAAHTDTSAAASSSGTDTSAPPDTTSGAPSEPELVHEVLWDESFEDGWAGWTVEGAWGVGVPSNTAAPAAKDQAWLVGTGLEGPYHRESGRLLSPKFIVPPANRQPYLRYWYWYQLEAGDTVQVQVRVGEEVNWVDLHAETGTISTLAGHGSRWMQALLPLEKFGEQEIQLSFALTATGENCAVPGFFIDAVSLETGPMNICSCQGFNDGKVGDWSIEGGQWGVGAGSSPGAPAPQTGNGLAGTNLAGAYESLAAAPLARLSSPTFTVANPYQSARFYYWHSFAAAGRGKIQSRVMGGEWEDVLDGVFTGASVSSFTFREIELSPWVGQTVQFGFLIENGAGADTPTTAGFYIDEFFYIE